MGDVEDKRGVEISLRLEAMTPRSAIGIRVRMNMVNAKKLPFPI